MRVDLAPGDVRAAAISGVETQIKHRAQLRRPLMRLGAIQTFRNGGVRDPVCPDLGRF